MKKILILADQKNQVAPVIDYFDQAGYRTILISRTQLIAEQKLVVTEKTVCWGEDDLLDNTSAALIFSQDYMWPQPVKIPSQEEWALWQSDLDSHLRDEREAASLWFSLLDILSENLDCCINTREAREAAVFLPMSFQALEKKGFKLPSYCFTNDDETLKSFMKSHSALCLEIPLDNPFEALEINFKSLSQNKINPEPKLIQLWDNDDSITVHHIGQQVFGDLSDTIKNDVLAMANYLELKMGHWLFRKYQSEWMLSVFSSVPDLTILLQEDLLGFFMSLEKIINESAL